MCLRAVSCFFNFSHVCSQSFHVSFFTLSFFMFFPFLYICIHSLLVQAVYTCLIVFTGRCAGLIRFICTSYRFYGFYSAVSPAVQLLPPKLIFEPGMYRNALLPFCYMPRHPLSVDTVTAICNIHHISCHGYLQESVEETCLPVSRVVPSLSSPFSYPMHFTCLLGLPHFS